MDLEPFEPRIQAGNTAVRQSNYLNQGYNLVQQSRQTQPVQYQPVNYQQQQPQYQQSGYRPQSTVQSQFGHHYLK